MNPERNKLLEALNSRIVGKTIAGVSVTGEPGSEVLRFELKNADPVIIELGIRYDEAWIEVDNISIRKFI